MEGVALGTCTKVGADVSSAEVLDVLSLAIGMQVGYIQKW
jgi:hypothetical protein